MTSVPDPSPTVDKLSWGKMKIGDKMYKDCKLWPGGSREWDWNETGTKHIPGVQPEDIKEILSKGVDMIIISRGMQGVLQVSESTIDYAKAHGAQVVVCLTEHAVKKYNELASNGTRIGGIFHSTC